MITLAAILAYGTFYEAEHGTAQAQRVIYKSWFMSLELCLLIINLTCAAIDRMPWKKNHVGFVITHSGIITLLLGSFITQQKGLDGSLPLSISETADSFMVPEAEFQVYQSFDGRPFALLLQSPVDFDRKTPEKNDYTFKLVDDDVIKVTRYIAKAVRRIEVKASESKASMPAVLFKLYNERVNVNEWLGLDNQIPPFYDLGPATVSFIKGNEPKPEVGKNQILLVQDPKTLSLRYTIYSMRQVKPVASGIVEPGKDYDTGWMNLKFKVEKYFPSAEVDAGFVDAERGNENHTQAIEAQIGNKKSWFELGNPHEIKGAQTKYWVNFTHRKFNLGFQLNLKKFKLATYGGSHLPMSYESTVLVDSKQEIVISMNEPLHNKDFTLYQSSYELNERGEPTVSVFSVNYDPGRRIKYLGSICICLGIMIMFYWKPRWTRKKKV
ncbi:MAG: cytochrome c biogenesis protein ResB [Oligoflexia bacterium]|nr:cytochrome c biogenesis protein ResB [Oligoflexia bacterium]